MNIQRNLNELYPCVHAVANAVPDHILPQSDVLDIARVLFGRRMRDFERFIPVFHNTGIFKRHAARPIEWYEADERGWQDRNDAYLEAAGELFKKAAADALIEAGLEAADIDTVVTVSSTGISTPTIEARHMAEMGFRENVQRVPVFGLGCAGGVSGLSIGARLAMAQPGSNVLVVAIELCTLSFRHEEITKANIVASALFGDGAAAVIISTRHQGARAIIERTGEHTWQDTLNVMGWSVDPLGMQVIFDRSIPELVLSDFEPVMDDFLAQGGINRGAIDGYVFHPGGTKVVEALESVLQLPQGQLNAEREALYNYGNMSAPTVFFVLREILGRKFEGRHFMSALGPGFTASMATLLAP